MKKIILTLMMAVVSLSSFAQFGGGQFQMPKPEEMATRRADQVKEQVKDAGQLTDEQYKKVYDLYLKQSKDMQAKMWGSLEPRKEGTYSFLLASCSRQHYCSNILVP